MEGPAGEPTRFLLGFEGPVADALLLPDGTRLVASLPVLRAVLVESSDPAALRAWALDDARVRYLEPEGEVVADRAPRDPLWDHQHGPQQVRAPRAWDKTRGSIAESVCVLDTGVRHTHEDLKGPRWLGGVDLVNLDLDPWDDHGHGTHVSGIAAATLDNGAGIAGMAQVGLRAGKVLRANGAGSVTTLAVGVVWCADSGSRVLSLSLSTPSSSSLLKDAVAHAHARGALIVASAGNAGPCDDCIGYPARYPEVVAVACADQWGAPCADASAGPELELLAPGDGIVSTGASDDEDYRWASGASVAVPHVSGAAALVWSAHPGLSSEAVRGLLRCTARDLEARGWDARAGHGLLDAGGALEAAAAGAC